MHPENALGAVAKEYVDYSVENARRAVTLMLAVIDGCVLHGQMRDAQRDSWRNFLADLRNQRWP